MIETPIKEGRCSSMIVLMVGVAWLIEKEKEGDDL